MQIFTIKKEKGTKNRAPTPSYMMVRMTPEEALATMASLARQLANRDPNTERLENVVGGEGDYNGFFSISVAHDPHCLVCGEEVGFHGKFQKSGYVCQKHLTHGEQAIRELEDAFEVPELWYPSEES